MNVTIHRGENQIGGNIIEISTETTRILLDVGTELDQETLVLPQVDGLFVHAAFDAVFLSHYHGDHMGLAYYIDKQIPLYMGKASYQIVHTMDTYFGRPTIQPAGYLIHQQAVTVGDITVTPFLCDHSAFDSYMLLCEAGGERILYTGDFRATGRKSFQRLLDVLPDRVDRLICEGTTLSRSNYAPVSEAELEDQAVALFSETTGPIFVLQSATNIDRIVTMYRAARRSGRIFLQELYMAEITASVGGNIPNPMFQDVFAFSVEPARYETLSGHSRISKDRMAKEPFVMCVRSSMLPYLKRRAAEMPFAGGILVYSMWQGYRKKPQMQRFLDGCTALGLRIVDLHTGGHADGDTIRTLIEHVHPQQILPVHTENAAWFSNLYPTP